MLSLSVISPERKIYEGEVLRVDIPGALAPFSVLKGHSSLISQLGSGIFSIYSERKEDIHFAIEDGLVEVKDDMVTVLIERAVYPNDINLDSEQERLDELLTKVTHSKPEREAKQKEIENIRTQIRLAHSTKNT